MGLFPKRNDDAYQLIEDVTGEDATRILTRLPLSCSASEVLTQIQNLCAGDDNDTHITEESFLLLNEENKPLKRRLEDLESHYHTRCQCLSATTGNLVSYCGIISKEE